MAKHREIALMLWTDPHLQKATDTELALFAKAYQFSMDHHIDRLRQSGESYYRHDCRTSARVLGSGFGVTLAAVMLIHEIVEDDGWTIDQVSQRFGQDVAEIVNGVSKGSSEDFPTREARLQDHISRLQLVIPNCWPVAVAKCIDRVDNATDTAALNDKEKFQLFSETEDNFLPLFEWAIDYVPSEYQPFYLMYIREIQYACDNYWQTRVNQSRSP